MQFVAPSGSDQKTYENEYAFSGPIICLFQKFDRKKTYMSAIHTRYNYVHTYIDDRHVWSILEDTQYQLLISRCGLVRAKFDETLWPLQSAISVHLGLSVTFVLHNRARFSRTSP